tara:strand:- start:1511 stop:2050 length:540 start_codon:yes stop_codon:yes gene_type:complete
MSQLNVNTIGARTGTEISIASGHTLAGVGNLKSAQTFRLTAGIGGSVDAAITSNWEVPDTENQGNMGSLVSESSGIFTFSETGYYLIIAQGSSTTNTAGNVTIETHITNDNSTYTMVAEARTHDDNSNDTTFSHTIIDVTNISNDKVKFYADVDQSNCELRGSTTQNLTCVSFIKLGAT